MGLFARKAEECEGVMLELYRAYVLKGAICAACALYDRFGKIPRTDAEAASVEVLLRHVLGIQMAMLAAKSGEHLEALQTRLGEMTSNYEPLIQKMEGTVAEMMAE